jgi:hypothetical protein
MFWRPSDPDLINWGAEHAGVNTLFGNDMSMTYHFQVNFRKLGLGLGFGLVLGLGLGLGLELVLGLELG